MAEASKRFYRVQIVLTVVGAVLLFGLCAQLLRQGSTPVAFGFGVVFCLLLLLTLMMTVMRLVGKKYRQARKDAGADADDDADAGRGKVRRG